MAGIAVDCGVRSGEREAVIVLLDIADGDLPSTYCVALFAVRSQLTPVNVGVAILAVVADAGEYRPYMTLGAGHGFVHAAQGIFRLVVIEFWQGADRTPRLGGMTVLARNIQVSMRTASHFGVLLLRLSAECRHRQKKDDK